MSLFHFRQLTLIGKKQLEHVLSRLTGSSVKRYSPVKETVHPKILILSSFTHPQVDPNLYECVCSDTKEIF